EGILPIFIDRGAPIYYFARNRRVTSASGAPSRRQPDTQLGAGRLGIAQSSVLSGLGEGPEPGLLCSGRRKLIEDAAGKGGRGATERNLMPEVGHKLADVSWDFRRERRNRGHSPPTQRWH